MSRYDDMYKEVDWNRICKPKNTKRETLIKNCLSDVEKFINSKKELQERSSFLVEFMIVDGVGNPMGDYASYQSRILIKKDN